VVKPNVVTRDGPSRIRRKTPLWDDWNSKNPIIHLPAQKKRAEHPGALLSVTFGWVNSAEDPAS